MTKSAAPATTTPKPTAPAVSAWPDYPNVVKHLEFTEKTKNDRGGTEVSHVDTRSGKDQNKRYLQLPPAYSPYGFSERTTKNKDKDGKEVEETTYNLAVELEHWNEERTDKFRHKEVVELFEGLREKLADAAVANQKGWFSTLNDIKSTATKVKKGEPKKTPEQVQEAMDEMIRNNIQRCGMSDYDEEKNALPKISVKVHPIRKRPVPAEKRFEYMPVLDVRGKPIYKKNGQRMYLQDIPRGALVSLILKWKPIYFMDKNYGFSWGLHQVIYFGKDDEKAAGGSNFVVTDDLLEDVQARTNELATGNDSLGAGVESEKKRKAPEDAAGDDADDSGAKRTKAAADDADALAADEDEFDLS